MSSWHQLAGSDAPDPVTRLSAVPICQENVMAHTNSSLVPMSGQVLAGFRLDNAGRIGVEHQNATNILAGEALSDDR